MQKTSPLSVLLTAAALAVAIIATAVLTIGVAQAATPEPMDFEPQVLAKLAKEKARASSQNAQDAAAASSRKAGQDCGAINIGNVVGGNRTGFSPTEVNVIITGDVINANTRCR
jgi:cytoskeletal protein RodZ